MESAAHPVEAARTDSICVRRCSPTAQLFANQFSELVFCQNLHTELLRFFTLAPGFLTRDEKISLLRNR